MKKDGTYRNHDKRAPETEQSTPLPDQEPHVVEEWLLQRSERYPDESLTVEQGEIHLANGDRYDVRRYLPKRIAFDVPAQFTTPWGTDIDHGSFNDMFGHLLAKEGMVVTAVSPVRKDMAHAFELARGKVTLPLAHAAHAGLAIHNYFGQPGHTDQNRIILSGYSMGGVEAIAAAGFAQTHGVTPAYADVLDPYIPNRKNRSSRNPGGHVSYAHGEFGAMVHELRGHRPGDMGRIALGFIPTNPSRALVQLALARALDGDEARDFVQDMPRDTPLYAELFTESAYNDISLWQDALSQYQYSLVQMTDGYHMTGIDPRFQRETAGRIVAAQRVLADDGMPKDVIAAVRNERAKQSHAKQ